MGLFDYVRSEVPLPDGWQSSDLQTKDFDMPYMEVYTIRADGRLIHSKPRYDITRADELCGDIDTNFHGILSFGGLETIGHHPPREDGWRAPMYRSHRYEAKFTDGQLVGITLESSDDIKSEDKS
jgi:hypothetical protein